MRTISLKLILRSWWRNKTFAIISILSLAVGIACTNLLTAYVIYELGIEAGNPNKERIICMTQDSPMTSGKQVSYITGQIPGMLKEQYPEVEDYVRMNQQGVKFVTIGENSYEPIHIVTADPSFPRFFLYKTLAGNLNKALTQPGMIALSEDCAQRFFGQEDPIGKTLSVTPLYEESKITYEVAAVFEDYPQSFLFLDAITSNAKDFYGGTTFLLVNSSFNIDTFAGRLKKDKVPTMQNELGQYYFYTLQESYFQQYTEETLPYIHRNQKTLLYVGLCSAFLILLIACFNYVNLSFSRVLQQVKMIYTQTLMGASFRSICNQLFLDTFLTVLIAFMLSLLITLDLLPQFNQIVSGRISIAFFFSADVLPVICGFILLLAIIPAIYMSRRIAGLSHTGYRTYFTGKKKKHIIAGLSITQFCISIGLIFATLTVRDQLALVETNGDRYRNVIEIGDWMGGDIPTINLLAEEIRKYPEIEDLAFSKGSIIHFGLRQIILKDESGTETYHSLGQFAGDANFLKVMRLKILQGLPEEQALKEYKTPVYINEPYAHLFVPKGENPVGKPVKLYDTEFGKMEKSGEPAAVIAGVIESLYTGTLQQKVFPSLTYLKPEPPYNIIHIRLKEENKSETLALLKKAWERVDPDGFFTYVDLYDEFMSQNRKTLEFANLLTMYSIISLLLTISGLFGMALYATEQRTKEIGIRKVNGATSGEIMLLLNRQFIGWIAIAFFISAPVTWYLLNRWLENFAYRVDVSISTSLLSGCIVLLITVLTVCWHSYKAASRNPVKALRSE